MTLIATKRPIIAGGSASTEAFWSWSADPDGLNNKNGGVWVPINGASVQSSSQVVTDGFIRCSTNGNNFDGVSTNDIGLATGTSYDVSIFVSRMDKSPIQAKLGGGSAQSMGGTGQHNLSLKAGAGTALVINYNGNGSAGDVFDLDWAQISEDAGQSPPNWESPLGIINVDSSTAKTIQLSGRVSAQPAADFSIQSDGTGGDATISGTALEIASTITSADHNATVVVRASNSAGTADSTATVNINASSTTLLGGWFKYGIGSPQHYQDNKVEWASKYNKIVVHTQPAVNSPLAPDTINSLAGDLKAINPNLEVYIYVNITDVAHSQVWKDAGVTGQFSAEDWWARNGAGDIVQGGFGPENEVVDNGNTNSSGDICAEWFTEWYLKTSASGGAGFYSNAGSSNFDGPLVDNFKPQALHNYDYQSPRDGVTDDNDDPVFMGLVQDAYVKAVGRFSAERTDASQKLIINGLNGFAIDAQGGNQPLPKYDDLIWGGTHEAILGYWFSREGRFYYSGVGPEASRRKDWSGASVDPSSVSTGDQVYNGWGNFNEMKRVLQYHAVDTNKTTFKSPSFVGADVNGPSPSNSSELSTYTDFEKHLRFGYGTVRVLSDWAFGYSPQNPITGNRYSWSDIDWDETVFERQFGIGYVSSSEPGILSATQTYPTTSSSDGCYGRLFHDATNRRVWIKVNPWENGDVVSASIPSNLAGQFWWHLKATSLASTDTTINDGAQASATFSLNKRDARVFVESTTDPWA